MKKVYPFSAYNQLQCLKVSVPMWGAMLFLARPFAIIVMSLANRKDRTGLLNAFYGDHAAFAIDILAGLPALLVIYAWFRRRPGASSTITWIWAHGRSLLITATSLNIASVFLPFLWEPDTRMDLPELAKLAICCVILFMLIRSERVRDTFDDFPQPIDEDKPRRGYRVLP